MQPFHFYSRKACSQGKLCQSNWMQIWCVLEPVRGETTALLWQSTSVWKAPKTQPERKPGMPRGLQTLLVVGQTWFYDAKLCWGYRGIRMGAREVAWCSPWWSFYAAPLCGCPRKQAPSFVCCQKHSVHQRDTWKEEVEIADSRGEAWRVKHGAG